MKVINFSVKEILSSLLDKSKIQTIREIKVAMVYKSRTTYEPPTHQVGDKVKIGWDLEDTRHQTYCSGCGKHQTQEAGVCFWGCNKTRCTSVFNKHLGTVKITAVFEIEMGKDNFGCWIKSKLWSGKYIDSAKKGWREGIKIYDDFAKRDGFKNAGEMFKFFDKQYDLSSPKKFHVSRWRWEAEGRK